jgi:hypothetical protein
MVYIMSTVPVYKLIDCSMQQFPSYILDKTEDVEGMGMCLAEPCDVTEELFPTLQNVLRQTSYCMNTERYVNIMSKVRKHNKRK